MKLIYCPECHDVFLAISKMTRTCLCGKHAAKYLIDNITAVMTEGALVFGIDNVTFGNARARNEHFQESEDLKNTRIDSFFTGWIPTIPGEVVTVPTAKDVFNYDFKVKFIPVATPDIGNPATDINE